MKKIISFLTGIPFTFLLGMQYTYAYLTPEQVFTDLEIPQANAIPAVQEMPVMEPETTTYAAASAQTTVINTPLVAIAAVILVLVAFVIMRRNAASHPVSNTESTPLE